MGKVSDQLRNQLSENPDNRDAIVAAIESLEDRLDTFEAKARSAALRRGI